MTLASAGVTRRVFKSWDAAFARGGPVTQVSQIGARTAVAGVLAEAEVDRALGVCLASC